MYVFLKTIHILIMFAPPPTPSRSFLTAHPLNFMFFFSLSNNPSPNKPHKNETWNKATR